MNNFRWEFDIQNVRRVEKFNFSLFIEFCSGPRLKKWDRGDFLALTRFFFFLFFLLLNEATRIQK